MVKRSNKLKLLVVDDEPVSLTLATRLLENALPEATVESVDGPGALRRIAEHHPDLILTDLFMPEVDGFMLIGEVRRRHADIPVVVMTAHGSEQAAVRALQAGAASYVPKQHLADDLVNTVRSVLAVRAQHATYQELFRFMTTVSRSFSLPNRTELITPVVAELQSDLRRLAVCPEEDLNRLGVAMTEALTNAMIHGNLGLPGRLMDDGIEAFRAMIEMRQAERPWCDRRVYVDVRADRGEAVLTIRDEGDGFDPRQIPDPRDGEMMLRTHGRGLLLIRTFMDEVTFNDNGNTITLVKRSHDRQAGADRPT